MAAAFMLMAGGISVTAAPELKPDGTFFDPIYYAAMNPDVLYIYGLDPNRLYEHYQTFGRLEGRLPLKWGQYPQAPQGPRRMYPPLSSGITGLPF